MRLSTKNPILDFQTQNTINMKTFKDFIEESNRAVPILRQHKYAKEWGVKNIWHVYNSQTKEETGYNIEKLASNKWKLIDPNQENIQYFPSLAACKTYLRATIGAFNLEEDYLEESVVGKPVLKAWGPNYWRVFHSVTKQDTSWTIEKKSEKDWILTDPNGDYIEHFKSKAAAIKMLLMTSVQFGGYD